MVQNEQFAWATSRWQSAGERDPFLLMCMRHFLRTEKNIREKYRRLLKARRTLVYWWEHSAGPMISLSLLVAMIAVV